MYIEAPNHGHEYGRVSLNEGYLAGSEGYLDKRKILQITENDRCEQNSKFLK